MLAGGLHGIEQGLELEPELVGNAYDSDKPHVPSTMTDARERFAASEVARSCFGDEVVDHYVNMADVELAAVRRHGHRLGAAPGVRATVTHLHRRQPRHRAGRRRRHARRRGRDRRRDRGLPRGVPGVEGASRPASGRRCSAGSPPWWTRTSRSWPSSRSATRATPGATPAGRPATSGTASTTTPGRPSGCPAGRSRSPAAPTSRSTSRSASSASSCPGTSRCRSRAGGSRPRWRPATRSSSSRPRSLPSPRCGSASWRWRPDSPSTC